MPGNSSVLVVDDEPSVGDALSVILSESGYHVRSDNTLGAGDVLLKHFSPSDVLDAVRIAVS